MYTRMSQRHIDLQHVRIFIHYFFFRFFVVCTQLVRQPSGLAVGFPSLHRDCFGGSQEEQAASRARTPVV